MTITLVVLGVFAICMAGLAVYWLTARASKYKSLYQQALNQIVLERKMRDAEAKHTANVIKKVEQLNEVIRKMDRGEISVDELNSIRSGVLPQSIQKPS